MNVHVAMRFTLKWRRSAVQTSGGLVKQYVAVFHCHIVTAKMMVLYVQVPRFVGHVVQMNDGADNVCVLAVIMIVQVASTQVFANTVCGSVY